MKAEDAIRIASSYIGVSGTDNQFNLWIWGFHCYDPSTYPWCAAFQSFVFKHDGGMACTASASASGFATQFNRIDDSEVKPGDLVVFNWDGRSDTSWCDHIGLVEWFDHGSGYFGTIEGNTGWTAGGEVARVTRYNYGSYFTAFYRPAYDGQPASQGPGGSSGSSGSGPDTGGSGGSGGGSSYSGGEWQGELVGKHDTTRAGDDYAGVPGRPIRYLAIGGVGKYQASDINHGWWPEVEKYDLDDEENGMAGNGDPFDRVRIRDATVKYQTHNLGGGWNSPMQGLSDTGGTTDDFAGETGVQQDLFRCWREFGEQPLYNVFS